jgi:hypothetical protein
MLAVLEFFAIVQPVVKSACADQARKMPTSRKGKTGIEGKIKWN